MNGLVNLDAMILIRPHSHHLPKLIRVCLGCEVGSQVADPGTVWSPIGNSGLGLASPSPGCAKNKNKTRQVSLCLHSECSTNYCGRRQTLVLDHMKNNDGGVVDLI